MPRIKPRAKGAAREIRNRSARHDFTVQDAVVAGVVLEGSQVKEIRAGKADITGSFVRVVPNEDGRLEAWVHGMTIGNESHGRFKLLLTREQLSHLVGVSQEKHATLVVLRGFFSHGFFKLELAPGKRVLRHDKRANLRERDLEREAARN